MKKYDFSYCMKHDCNSCKRQRECEEEKNHGKRKKRNKSKAKRKRRGIYNIIRN